METPYGNAIRSAIIPLFTRSLIRCGTSTRVPGMTARDNSKRNTTRLSAPAKNLHTRRLYGEVAEDSGFIVYSRPLT